MRMQMIFVSSIEQGVEHAKEILYKRVDRKTVLFLSGGASPKPLYDSLATEQQLHPAAVALTDERFGQPMHTNSNEKMLRDAGLFSYFTMKQIPIHFILQKNATPEATAFQYDLTIKDLFFKIPKSLAVVSIGADGHTAGLPAMQTFITPENKHLFVIHYNDRNGIYKERITLTFQGLSMIDFFILWVFGKEKNDALKKIFTRGGLEEVPGRLYNQPDISKKTVLITDLKL